MAKTTRQTSIFGAEDWKRLYQTFREADLQSYDYETLRKSMVDYLRLYYPETFNDFTESSEFIALLDLMAFMGQGLAFRNDLNARENFIDTAERRDSVVKLAELVGYKPKRNQNAQGYIKVTAVSTTESVTDYNGLNLSGATIRWNDATNADWFEQFNAVMNAAMVSSQRYGRPGHGQSLLGVQTDEYELNVTAGYLPVVPFNATVDGVGTTFEVTSATSADKTYIYEPAPQPDGQMNVLYRNDKLGYGSANTGYFFYFKQGSLVNQQFNLGERISNREVDIAIDGVNNSDVWLFEVDGTTLTEWTKVDSIYGVGATPSVDGQQRTVYSVESGANDTITINFGDGVFSKIPVGTYRTYLRTSNGLEYVINPNEIQSVTVSLPYTSRNGRNETITFTLGLQEPVTNAKARETLDEIKTRAPARFYTQNRMVNGEDYNNFPYTQYTSILKSKAVGRSSIGLNRYLDLLDPTGKYSSTNSFCSDGMIYQDYLDPNFTFTFVDTNDISSAIVNTLEPKLADRSMRHFYNDKFARIDLTSTDILWQQSTTTTNQSTGYFKNAAGNPISVGEIASGNTKYIVNGALIKFEAPTGYYFDSNNKLKAGTPTGADEKLVVWATVTSLTGDGTNFGDGNLSDGSGPVALNDFLPTGADVTEVIPVFVTDIPNSVETLMIEQVELYRNFGIGFDNQTGDWYIISADNLDEDAEFSLNYAKNTDRLQRDASWLAQFTTDGTTYTVKYRNLNYYFASVAENRFIYDDNDNIYDATTGKVVNDFVNVIKMNSQPDSNSALSTDIKLDVVGQTVETDGFIDNFKVLVSYADSDADGVADNPDIFKDIVAPTVNAATKKVFLEKTTDFDNLERYVPVASDVINTLYADLDAMELAKTEYLDGQVFYGTTDKKFYKLTVSGTTYTLAQTTDYEAKTGRQDLYFHYRHNSSDGHRIDPAITNIVDLYLATNAYYTAYQNWINDTTGKVTEPTRPTIDELTVAYAGLQDYKMLSDNMIMNSVKFKPLFGAKSATELQATVKVIKYRGVITSTSEIKSRVVEAMNEYFKIDKWDFGDTFYFSELSAYLHEQLGDIVSSVVLVPLDPTKSFGDLYEIRSAPNEIFVNAATVNDIEVVDALTSTVLRTATNSGIV
jgi:hypothetical protein